MKRPIITLTTDFGPGPFAGIMKGVMHAICPQARMVDLSHAVPPQDVWAGALVLEQALEAFPYGAVHLGVVDPGVGSARRPICVHALGMLFVGPDNGLFTPALLADSGAVVWEIAETDLFRRPVSATFHGRDIFAPVAAHLAGGLDPAALGPLVRDAVRLDWPECREEGGALIGQVMGADHFGNLATNLDRARVEAFLAGASARVEAPGLEPLDLSPSYAALAPGRPVALFNSLDRLELAINQGDLRAELARGLGLAPGGERGLAVMVRRAE